MPLVEEDLKHFTAAQGYVELGMILDANEELENIDPEVRHVPEVLEVRLVIYRTLEKWELMQTVAKKLTEADPGNPAWSLKWAFATRRAESIEAARRVLMEAWKRHGKEPMLLFNLACYECQLGDLAKPKELLAHAFDLDSKMRLKALDDEALKPLWDAL